MPRNREPSPNGYTPLEEILRDNEREARIGSLASEHTPLHEILSDAPARESRTAPLSPPDPRDSDPLHTPLIVAPRYHWSDNVRSQYSNQLSKLYDAHRYDDGPTAAQIQAVRDWGSDLADREATGARFSAHGWQPGSWRDYSIHNYSDGKQDFTHPVGPQLIAGTGYTMPAGDRFNAFMAPKTGGLLTAIADAGNPGGDHTLARQADDLFLALGGVAAARAGQGSSMLGNNGSPVMPIYGGRTYTAPYYERNSGITPGMSMNRNFGGGSQLHGTSWTDVPYNGQTRYTLGLPPENTGELTAFGRVINPQGMYYRDAAPIGVNRGGAREIVVPQPVEPKVSIDGVHRRKHPLP
jgi:hypothetical protein